MSNFAAKYFYQCPGLMSPDLSSTKALRQSSINLDQKTLYLICPLIILILRKPFLI